MSIGMIGAIFAAFSWPILTTLFGEMVDVFVIYENSGVHNTKSSAFATTSEATNMTTDEFMSEIYLLSGTLFVSWVIVTLCQYLLMTFFPLAALNQIHTIKVKYFESVLKQEIAWFDSKSSGDFASRVSA